MNTNGSEISSTLVPALYARETTTSRLLQKLFSRGVSSPTSGLKV